MLHACFYTICLIFRYTSWYFYAFSGTNLLTSCHSASSLFSTIFVFQKWYTGNILRIGRNNFLKSYFSPKASRDMKRRWRGATRGPHARAARPRPWPCPLGVRPPRSTSDDAPSLIKTLLWKKPKYPINFPETHRDPLPSSTWDREGPEALPGTLPERGMATGGLLHHHAYLRCDEWVVYLGLWIHSSS
jgi:hypothetical protein